MKLDQEVSELELVDYSGEKIGKVNLLIYQLKKKKMFLILVVQR